MSPQNKAYIFALLAVACWSTIGSAFKLTLQFIDPLNLLLFSSLVACFVLLAIILLQGKADHLKKLTKRDFLWSAFLGLLNPFLYYVVLLEGYDILKAQEAGTLNYVWPLLLVLLSIPILGQHISWKSVGAILISFTGIILISTHPELNIPGNATEPGSPAVSDAHPQRILGIVLAVGSAFFWALYWIYNLKDQRETVTKLFLNFCFGFVYTAITVLLTGSYTVSNWQGIAGSVYVGIFEMGLTFVLWLKALQLSSTTAKVSNLIYLSPFLSLIIIHFSVGETILISTWVGLFLIVTGIIAQQRLAS